jgi:hypothetical protein
MEIVKNMNALVPSGLLPKFSAARKLMTLDFRFSKGSKNKCGLANDRQQCVYDHGGVAS